MLWRAKLLSFFVVGVGLSTSGCGEPEATRLARAPQRPQVSADALDLESVGCSVAPPVRRAPPEFDDADPSAVRLFYDVLAPYGTWVDDARLGLVWSPAASVQAGGFVPYATHGRWSHRAVETTSDGEKSTISDYVWVSDLPWGWVTFHYGRWTFAGDRGWAWIPGRRYAGAWVDWRAPHPAGTPDAIVGWGPTPPSQVWRVLPAPASTRSRLPESIDRLDVRHARFVAVPYAAFATPYSYARARDLFAPDLRGRLLDGTSALAVAHATEPGVPPSLAALGLQPSEAPAPPALDRGLLQAWMIATPASAMAVGAGPELGSPPRDRTYVTGGRRWSMR